MSNTQDFPEVVRYATATEKGGAKIEEVATDTKAGKAIQFQIKIKELLLLVVDASDNDLFDPTEISVQARNSDGVLIRVGISLPEREGTHA